jgi:hypothetical protein
MLSLFGSEKIKTENTVFDDVNFAWLQYRFTGQSILDQLQRVLS